MDKNAIKKYAIWARNELIERVTQKALQYEITDENITDANADSVNDKLLTPLEKKQRQALIDQVEQKGFEQVIEEVAYTWFNRFCALRFMEVNGYLPTHIRVFTDEDNNFKPQILTEAIHLELDGLDINKVYELKEADKDEELYKYLLITQCNALSSILPGMFQKIADYTELLLPDNLLRDGSVIEQMIVTIPEDNFDISSENGQVEIIGWLYQYYISEKHKEVTDPLHGKVVNKDDIPAATQLFTTDWVVRYIVDNSVGRYWIERNSQSNLKDSLEYFVTPKDGKIEYVNETITPQELTVFDPCMGSGHFLIYAFEVLMKIYEEYGYSQREAAQEIVEHNIYGLDIDDRASQLAYFAVIMKARQYDRRFLTREVKPHIYAIQESNHLDYSCIEYFENGNQKLETEIHKLISAMLDAKEYGSIIELPEIDFDIINERLAEIDSDYSFYREMTLKDILPLVNVAEIMEKKYSVVITNPPYLNKYDEKLKKYVTANFKDYSGDLFSVFIYRNFGYCKSGGYSGFMTPFVWMFIKTYEKLRNYIINYKSITTLIQMEYSAFEEATVPICSFILKNEYDKKIGLYFKLTDFKGGMDVQRKKILEGILNKKCNYFYETPQVNFTKIPTMPIAYWIGERILKAFNSNLLGDYGYPKQGFATGNNDRFLRFWYEVETKKIGMGCSTRKEALESHKKWFPCNKGGGYRRWYGNNFYIANWENDGEEMTKFSKSVIRNPQFYFQKGITWCSLTSGKLSMRYSPEGFIFESKGSVCFMKDESNLLYILGLMNTEVVSNLLLILSPTLDYHEGPLSRVPIIINDEKKEEAELLSQKSIDLCKYDWDAFETSWDFVRHPLIQSVTILKQAYLNWEKECEKRFNMLKENEEKLNTLFIDIYGLQKEISPEVEDKNVTVRKADFQRDIKSFISYAVGCMFGRYSLDVDGLAYAGGDFDVSKYHTFEAVSDNIISICDDEYFEDDIVGRFVKFVEVVYGKDTLEENLRFIADALDGKGKPRDVIRKYFLNDFYKEHVKMYQKRPIYWLFDSGKKNGFKALIYMHRYKPDTIARIRTDYVHEQQGRYRTSIEDIKQRINNASTSERVKLNKELTKLQDKAAELKTYEEKIHHLADQMIPIDLDHGVKVNYEKFKDVLAKIK